MPSTSPTDTVRPPSFARRVLLPRIAFTGAVLLTFVAGFYVVEQRLGEARWKSYQAEARARGVKLTLAEYVPPPVPDERNFAAIPLFQDAFRTPPPSNPLNLPMNGALYPPPLDVPSKSASIDLRAWQAYFVAVKFLPAAGENAAADVLTALERFAPEFAQLRSAGSRPECSFPVRYEDGIYTAMPHLAILQSAVRLYALRMAAHLTLQASDAAYEDFRGGLRIYHAGEKEPSLIAGLVRLSALTVLENAVWGGIARQQWNDETMEKIAADLAGVRAMGDYAFALNSERAFSNLIHDQLIRQGTSKLASVLAVTAGPGESRNRPAEFLSSLYPSGWLRLSQTRSNRYVDEMLARMSPVPPRIFAERPVPSEPSAGRPSLERLQYLLFFVMAPALSDVERNYAFHQTLLDETRLGCALERYRLAHGGYPASLEALVPSYCSTLPQDVMTGASLHYRAGSDGGYALYSVGWNLRDDGGKLEAKISARKQLDWVWSIPSAAQP